MHPLALKALIHRYFSYSWPLISINDSSNPQPLWNNEVRRPLERLVRKLLDYPLRPAILLLHAYDWQISSPRVRRFVCVVCLVHAQIGLHVIQITPQ